jgi:hypothetical protein
MSDNKFKDKDINTENDSSQDSGIELLHLVIESNKAVEISGKAIFHMYCDIKEDEENSYSGTGRKFKTRDFI